MIGQGNINFEWAIRSREELQKQQHFLQKAMGKYIQVLENDESNCAASIGVANVLAEFNKIGESLDLFKLAKEN